MPEASQDLACLRVGMHCVPLAHICDSRPPLNLCVRLTCGCVVIADHRSDFSCLMKIVLSQNPEYFGIWAQGISCLVRCREAPPVSRFSRPPHPRVVSRDPPGSGQPPGEARAPTAHETGPPPPSHWHVLVLVLDSSWSVWVRGLGSGSHSRPLHRSPPQPVGRDSPRS